MEHRVACKQFIMKMLNDGICDKADQLADEARWFNVRSYGDSFYFNQHRLKILESSWKKVSVEG